MLIAHPELVQGQRILELGSGVGLTGLCVAMLAPASLVLTDYDGDEQGQSVLQNLRHNLAVNGLGPPPLGELVEGDAIPVAPVDAAAGVDGHLYSRKSKPAVRVELLDWVGATEESLAVLAGDTDLVLAADVVYTPSIVSPLVAVIQGLLKAAYPRKLRVLPHPHLTQF